MTYCLKLIILYKDCLVMKKIGNWLITEADTISFPYLIFEESYALGRAVKGQICLAFLFYFHDTKISIHI